MARVAAHARTREISTTRPNYEPAPISDMLGDWTLGKLARATNLHKTTVGKYFRGQCLPGFLEGIRIAQVLGVDPVDLARRFVEIRARTTGGKVEVYIPATSRPAVQKAAPTASGHRGSVLADAMGLPADHPLRRQG